MFKFVDADGLTVFINPSYITAIEHSKNESHSILIHTNITHSFWRYEPTSEEDCRQFLFNIFKAMGEEYKYE